MHFFGSSVCVVELHSFWAGLNAQERPELTRNQQFLILGEDWHKGWRLCPCGCKSCTRLVVCQDMQETNTVLLLWAPQSIKGKALLVSLSSLLPACWDGCGMVPSKPAGLPVWIGS